VIARLLDSGPRRDRDRRRRIHRARDPQPNIRDKAVSIWLQGGCRYHHAQGEAPGRPPLLRTPDPAATVGRLIEERDPVYRHADITIWSRDVPHEKIVDECSRPCTAGVRRRPTSAPKEHHRRFFRAARRATRS